MTEQIAIVGVGVRFPGGAGSLRSLDELAAFLRDGRSGTGPAPDGRWAGGELGPALGGFLDGAADFDAAFFGIEAGDARAVDPRQRLLLAASWEALENAGIDPGPLRGGTGAVFVGALGAGGVAGEQAAPLAAFLGWRGPSLSVDTAGASGLTALHLAATALREGDCDIALAAAAHCLADREPPGGAGVCADGRCKAFDEGADGSVPAEGCAVLLLKRLPDARAAGDPVLAVLRGTAVGLDGTPVARQQVMRAALADAGLGAGDIGYVEAHSTGTAEGDRLEVTAIGEVFGDSRTREHPLRIASVATNLGNLEPVAGLAGVAKALLQVRDGAIYPHLHLTRPAPRIPWQRYPLKVPTALEPWDAPVRRALVNGAGSTGALAAAVLEEPPVAEPAPLPPDEPAGYVFTVSARAARPLHALAQRYVAHLNAHPHLPVGDICYAGNVGRQHFARRLAGVVRDRDELSALLAKYLQDKEIAAPPDDGGPGEIAFLFTGQGSQYPGMGRLLYRDYPLFRRYVDECDELFAPPLGRSVRALLLDEAADGEAIHQTRFTQPALFTLEYALARLWQSFGVRPGVLIGHSIGEVVAAAVAGVFSLADAVTLVATRGRLMQSITAPGGMIAVPAPAEQVAPLLDPYPDVAVAAVNSPKQCVLSGGSAALVELTETLAAQRLAARPLPVSHAFHSPLMAEVYEEFGAALAGIAFRPPRLSVVSNVTGEIATTGQLHDPQYWVRHIGAPVNFLAGMRAVQRRGRHAFVEIGPSGALTSLGKQCVTAADHRWLTSVHPKDQRGSTIRASLAQLYAAGVDVSWTGFHAGRPRPRVPLPTYPFDVP